MPFVESDGARLYYEDSGGDGPVVAFSHGILMDHEMFAPQVDALKDRYRCVTWDERFQGLTEGDDPCTYWDSAKDLLAILDAIGAETAVLAGMSQGGFLSLRAALTAPEKVTGLFLIDTQAGAEEPEVGEMYRNWAQIWAEQGPQDHLIDASVALIISPAPAEKWTAKWRAWPPERAPRMIDTLLSREDITDRLGEITCPAVVVHGTADPSIPMDKAEALCAGLPGCKEVIPIEGGGHASNLSHPGEVNEALEKFLAGL